MTNTELHNEIITGPLAATLVTFVASGNDAAIAAALNEKTSTLTQRAPTTVADIFALISSGAISQANFLKIWQHARFPEFSAYLRGSADSPAPANFYPVLFLASGALTAAESQALATCLTRTATVPASRAEVLWGSGTIITHQQVAAALGRPGVF